MTDTVKDFRDIADDGSIYLLLVREAGSDGHWIKIGEVYSLQAANIMLDAYANFFEEHWETQVIKMVR